MASLLAALLPQREVTQGGAGGSTDVGAAGEPGNLTAFYLDVSGRVIDLAHGLIYWTDRGDDTVSRAPIAIPSGSTAATRTDREIVVRGVREAIGVTLDLARGKLFFTGGTLGRAGSANLDGTDLVDLVTGSTGLTGIVLAELP